MRRRIDLLNEHYNVTVIGRPEERQIKVDVGKYQAVALIFMENEESVIQLEKLSVRVKMAVKGEMTYIRAFGRTFALEIVDPVEQASQESGTRSNNIYAPMPGMVVEVAVAAGAQVIKGQSMMTIESMKILTVITAPRNGEVTQVHFDPEDAFDKNAVLITLSEKEIA